MEPKPMEQMPKMSEEDAAMWKEATLHYNKLKLYEHRMWQMDISAKIQLREAALAALPGTSPLHDLPLSRACRWCAHLCSPHIATVGICKLPKA